MEISDLLNNKNEIAMNNCPKAATVHKLHDPKTNPLK